MPQITGPMSSQKTPPCHNARQAEQDELTIHTQAVIKLGFFPQRQTMLPTEKVRRSRLHIGDRLTANCYDRHDHCVCKGDESFAHRLGLVDDETPLHYLQAEFLCDVHQSRAGDATQDAAVCPGDKIAVLGDDPGVGGSPFLHKAVRIDESSFLGACFLGMLAAHQHIGKQTDRLDVVSLPGVFWHGDHPDPRVCPFRTGSGISVLLCNHQNGARTIGQEDVYRVRAKPRVTCR